MGRPAGSGAAVVLLSGGLDSATTLAWSLERGFRTHALTVDYGQRHRLELERAARLASTLGASSHRMARIELPTLSGSSLTDPSIDVPHARTASEIGSGIPSTYVPARNTILLALALGLAEVLGAQEILIGANSVDYSGYPDCRPEYLAAFQELAARATRAGVEGRPIAIHAPLLRLTKGEIVREAVRLGVDLGQTLSCYDPGVRGEPCRRCDACLLRARGFRDAGIEDPGLENPD
jgi:7-cyano-7-deazaguanine synthase